MEKLEVNLENAISKGWKIAKLKYYLNVRNGKEVINLIEDEDAVDVYGSGGVFKKTDTHLHSGRSVLFGRKGTIGKPIYVDGKFWTVDTMYYTTFFNNMIPKWAYYMFFVFPWEAYTTKTALPSIVGTDIENAKWAIPSKLEQKKMVEYLDNKTNEIDTLIADKEKLIELLEEKRQAVITEAVTKGLDPNVPMKDSGVEWIGEIPEHWDVKKLKHIYKADGNGIKIGPFGSSLKLDQMSEVGIKVYGQENLIKQDFSIGKKYISENKFYQLRAHKVSPGDILFSMMGTLGKCEVVPADAEIGIMDSHLLRVTPEERIVVPEYIPLIIRDSMLSEIQMKLFSKGSIMSGINSTIVKNLIIVLPPHREQEHILNRINNFKKEVSSIIRDIKDVIEKLKEYRQSLIYEAVTGKIDVQEMDKEIEQEEVSSS